MNMNNRSYLVVVILLLIPMFHVACMATERRTESYFRRYVEIALSRYRDQSLWEEFDYIDLPRIADPTNIKYREDVGIFHSGTLKGDFPVVNIGIPIADPDNELKGANYVFIQFHHPSGKILIIMPSTLMY